MFKKEKTHPFQKVKFSVSYNRVRRLGLTNIYINTPNVGYSLKYLGPSYGVHCLLSLEYSNYAFLITRYKNVFTYVFFSFAE